MLQLCLSGSIIACYCLVLLPATCAVHLSTDDAPLLLLPPLLALLSVVHCALVVLVVDFPSSPFQSPYLSPHTVTGTLTPYADFYLALRELSIYLLDKEQRRTANWQTADRKRALKQKKRESEDWKREIGRPRRQTVGGGACMAIQLSYAPWYRVSLSL